MRRSIFAAATVALLAGCARREPPPAPPPPPPPILTPSAPLAPSPRAYVTIASSFDRLMISAAELAEARTGDPRLRSFAAQVKRDHQGIAAQLSFAGRRLDLLPTGRLLNEHVERLELLQAASDFDGAFRREMRRAHQAAAEHHRRFADRGDSPTLRPVARFAAETIARNLGRLQAI
jgi:predicted outer membrane protein